MKKSPIELAKFTDATLNRVLAAIKETIEVREGDRGDPKDRFVSVRDLQDSGVIVYTGAGANFQANPLPIRLQINLSKPPTPTGLVATGSFSNIFLTWDQYSYANHSHTEIFRSTTVNDRDVSVSIGTALGRQFVDAVEPLTTYYYWIRFVSSAGREGDFNTGINSGTTGASLKTVSELISDMNDELSSSSFATSFLNTVNSTFNQATAPTVKTNGKALVAGDLWIDTTNNVTKRYTGTAFVVVDIASSAAVDTKIIEQVGVCMFQPTSTTEAPYAATGLTTKTTCEAATSSAGTFTWDEAAAIAQSQGIVTSSGNTHTTTVSQTTSSINGLEGQYTVKIDPNNGAVSGFGLASTTNNNTTTSEFYIRADKFGLINQAASNLSGVTSPFLVDTDPAFSEKVFAISGERFPAPYTTQAQVNAANAALPSTSLFSYVFTASNTSIFLNGDAVIKRASIDSSVIKDLTVDKILRVPGEAFINEADIEDLSITTAHIKNYIESTNYANTANNFAGWRIDKNGSANFHDLTIRDSSGAILLSTGTGIDFTGITYNDIGGTKPPSNADKTSSNTAAGIANQGSLATQSSVAFSALTGAKPPSNADKTSSNTAAGIAGQGAYATVDKLVPDGAATTSLRRPISTFISDLAVDSLQIAGNAVTQAAQFTGSGFTAISQNPRFDYVTFAHIGSFAATTSVLVIATGYTHTAATGFNTCNVVQGIYKHVFSVPAGHIYSNSLFTASSASNKTVTYNGSTVTGSLISNAVTQVGGSASAIRQYFSDQSLQTVTANTVVIYGHHVRSATNSQSLVQIVGPKLTYVWALK
jgi:hypothetical protein